MAHKVDELPLKTPIDRGSDDVETYRVVIRLEALRANLLRALGDRPTDADIGYWLRGIGFTPATDGNAWLGGMSCLELLSPAVIVRAEIIREAVQPAYSFHSSTLATRLLSVLHTARIRFARLLPLAGY